MGEGTGNVVPPCPPPLKCLSQNFLDPHLLRERERQTQREKREGGREREREREREQLINSYERTNNPTNIGKDDQTNRKAKTIHPSA